MMFALFFLLLFPDFSKAQYFNGEVPWQFAGFAAINIPANDNEEIANSFLPYSPLQQYAIRNQNFENINSNIHQPQIQIAPQQPQIPSGISVVPKRENGNFLKVQENDKEKQQDVQLPELSRSSNALDYATYLSLINDKENFQVSGCGWDLIRLQCHDLFGLCKGACRDFAIALNSPIHDCRCVPFGYLALLKVAGK